MRPRPLILGPRPRRSRSRPRHFSRSYIQAHNMCFNITRRSDCSLTYYFNNFGVFVVLQSFLFRSVFPKFANFSCLQHFLLSAKFVHSLISAVQLQCSSSSVIKWGYRILNGTCAAASSEQMSCTIVRYSSDYATFLSTSVFFTL